MTKKRTQEVNRVMHKKDNLKNTQQNTRPNPRDTQRAVDELRGIASIEGNGVQSRGKPISIEGLSFEEILAALLKTKPKKKKSK